MQNHAYAIAVMKIFKSVILILLVMKKISFVFIKEWTLKTSENGYEAHPYEVVSFVIT